MSSYIIAGVGTVSCFDPKTGALILNSNTLQEESLSLSATPEEIRGGLSNPVLGRYFHDSMLECTLTDAMISLEHIALNAGGDIQAGTDVLTQEQVVVGAGGVVSVANTPVAFLGSTYGWVRPADGATWQTITFTGTQATTTLAEGTVACVKYAKADIGSEFFTVPSSIIPATVSLVCTYPVFAGGASAEISAKSQLGEMQVYIPRFQFSGSYDMSLTASGAATSNLSGQALATNAGASCSDMGAYGEIKLVLYDKIWYEELTNMYVDGAEKEMAVGDEATLAVYGVYGQTVGFIPNDKLIFASDDACATVDETGKITAVSTGTAHIEVKPKQESGASEPPAVSAYCEVTIA